MGETKMASIKEYAATLAKEAGFDEATSKAFIDSFGNDKIANAFVPRPDFSRSLDAKDAEVKKVKDDAAAYYAQQAELAARNQKVVDDAQARLTRYQQQYGELEGDGTVVHSPAIDTSKFVSVEAYQKELQRVEAQSLFVLKEGIKASQDYYSRFGKPLDIDKLEKFAIDNKLPINLAYEKLIQPEVATQQSASFEEKLKAAKEEGAREALSRVKVPVDTAQREPSVFASAQAARAQKDAAPASTADQLAAFTEAWNGGTNAAGA